MDTHEEASPVSSEPPAPVKEFIDVVNAHDDQALLDAFSDDGVVDDWGREFTDRAAIKAWSGEEFIGANGTMDVRRVDRNGDRRQRPARPHRPPRRQVSARVTPDRMGGAGVPHADRSPGTFS